ncbi:UvrB/UvrC motif-containing protein [Treponema peruense]|uniref:UvrB/UvrC motif-containing protein n=1 Tax=Treponema peruense TaxID=2787628 RepID=A0A7T3RF03_9SPIR|nr:UvrB/UvrC motif-containing protein [Treponema peruense]QQA01904.1 UvrB/UvrC motif-containing protein [Treponema peruense]
MLCDFCHEREAVIYMEQITGGSQKRRINICVECAVERGINPDPKSIQASLGVLFKELADTKRRMEEADKKLCPVCGTSLGKIKKTLNVGCPECYAIFRDDVTALLSQKGPVEPYKGTMPARLSTVHSVLNDRIILRNKLDDAVAAENYEKAALYRDYLKALEKTAVSGDGSFTGEDNGQLS